MKTDLATQVMIITEVLESTINIQTLATESSEVIKAIKASAIAREPQQTKNSNKIHHDEKTAKTRTLSCLRELKISWRKEPRTANKRTRTTSRFSMRRTKTTRKIKRTNQTISLQSSSQFQLVQGQSWEAREVIAIWKETCWIPALTQIIRMKIKLLQLLKFSRRSLCCLNHNWRPNPKLKLRRIMSNQMGLDSIIMIQK